MRQHHQNICPWVVPAQYPSKAHLIFYNFSVALMMIMIPGVALTVLAVAAYLVDVRWQLLLSINSRIDVQEKCVCPTTTTTTADEEDWVSLSLASSLECHLRTNYMWFLTSDKVPLTSHRGSTKINSGGYNWFLFVLAFDLNSYLFVWVYSTSLHGIFFN